MSRRAPAVWVLESEGSLLFGVVSLLRGHCPTVRGFSDPRGVLSAASTDPPAVLVTDLRMAGMSGVELSRRLRQRLGASCPRILLVTGSRPRRAELTLFDQVFRKPFRFDDLLAEVLRHTRPVARRSLSGTRPRRAMAGSGSSRTGGGSR